MADESGGPSWLKILLRTAAGAGSGYLGQHGNQQQQDGQQQPNPWTQLGQSVGKVAGKYINGRGVDPSKTNPAFYGPPNPAGSGPLGPPQSPMPPTPPLGPQASHVEPLDESGAPMMADGQIVTKPTLAIIGESEPEAVVPLGYRANAKVRPSMAFGKETRAPGKRFYGEA
jgi:hypothetical protein